MSYLVEQKKWIGVLGGSSRYDDGQILAAYKVGQELAKRDKYIMTGGTTGIPYSAAIGAKEGGALVVGISPASSFEDHVTRFKKPLDYSDLTVYTGMGVAGRSSVLVQSVCGSIFIGGESGTLNEFTAAWMCGNNILGILTGAGGISDNLNSLLSEIKTAWGSIVISEKDPVVLVQRVCEEVDKVYAERLASVSTECIGKDVRDIINKYKDRNRK